MRLQSHFHYTTRPFTVAVCGSCSTSAMDLVLPKLRAVIRNCHYGALVTTECLRGPISCAAGDSRHSVAVFLQPCSIDRTPTAAGQWVGPIRTEIDAITVADWIAAGVWNGTELPARLRLGANLARSSRLN